jgi:putative transposase
LATVHLCFVPKRRKPVLVGEIRTRLNEIFQSVAKDQGWFIRSVEIAPDHVHLLVEYDSKHSVAEVAKAFKGRSSRLLRKESPEPLKLPSLWPRSYFYETTGKVSTSKIKEYIEDRHHW